MKGLFLFNKPAGISSAGFLNKLKKYFSSPSSAGREKIGHGGTLDPFASGLLVVGVGREYTRNLDNFLKGSNKKYNAEIILGAGSTTYDLTGEIKDVDLKNIGEKEIEIAVEKIKSKKEQTPPIFSALKVKGEKAYDLARRGEVPELKPRKVELIDYKINSVEKLEGGKILLDITLEVSSGFYIRSFAHDLGVELGSDGYVQSLIRTKIGKFDLKEALTAEDLDNQLELYFEAKGGVQGVGYRYFALKNAQKWAITGFVRNIGEMAVEVMGQGNLANLNAFFETLKTGPEVAKIESIFAYFRKQSGTWNDFEAKRN